MVNTPLCVSLEFNYTTGRRQENLQPNAVINLRPRVAKRLGAVDLYWWKCASLSDK